VPWLEIARLLAVATAVIAAGQDLFGWNVSPDTRSPGRHRIRRRFVAVGHRFENAACSRQARENRDACNSSFLPESSS